jgi:hypothetical protein
MLSSSVLELPSIGTRQSLLPLAKVILAVLSMGKLSFLKWVTELAVLVDADRKCERTY